MYKQTNTIYYTKRIWLFALIINCTIIVKTDFQFSRNVYAVSNRIWCNKHLRHTTMENMIPMGKVDTSDLMMIITWAIDISFQSPILKWASWTHTTPYIVMNHLTFITIAVCKLPAANKIILSTWEKNCEITAVSRLNKSCICVNVPF